MFFHDFELSDILLDHYLFSVFICIFAVIVTLFVSKRYNLPTNLEEGMKFTPEKSQQSSKCQESENGTSFPKPVIKESSALLAEKVIEANMTEEQRKLEYEVRQQQLAQIHELMLKQSDKFGNISLSDVEEQMKLYQ